MDFSKIKLQLEENLLSSVLTVVASLLINDDSLLLLFELFGVLLMLFDGDVDCNTPSTVASSSSSFDELTKSVLFSSAVISTSSLLAVFIVSTSFSLSAGVVVSNSVVDELLTVVDDGIRSNRSGCSCTATKCVHTASSTLIKTK